MRLSTGPKLVQVRNPWGVKEYTGAWSDKSKKWTQALKDEVDFENKEDGTFYMSYGVYRKKFGQTWINYDPTDWSKDGFLMLDDDTQNPGTSRLCGEDCTRHEFTLKSDRKQMVTVSANTWQSRPVPKGCKNQIRKKTAHTFEVVGKDVQRF